MMHTILHRAQQRVGYWVGSSVIHLGDHNVPNSLMFIDKYTQIFRILLPVVTCIESIDQMVKTSPALANYIKESFGSAEGAKKSILTDFFRHAFDGSGERGGFQKCFYRFGNYYYYYHYCLLLLLLLLLTCNIF